MDHSHGKKRPQKRTCCKAAFFRIFKNMNKKIERNRQADKERTVTHAIRIAIYMRLSKTDETVAEESNSISMQRILIRKYIASHFAE